jgi:lipopolysaccharide export system protein LptA
MKSVDRAWSVAAMILTLALAAPGAVRAAPDAGGGISNLGGFDELYAQDVQFNDKSGEFSIPNRFKATRGGTEVNGDRAKGNSKTKITDVTGNVVVHMTRPLAEHPDLASQSQDPSTLTCDHLHVDGMTKSYLADGHVHFTQGLREATADRGTLSDVTHILHMEGRVHLRDGESTFESDTIDYNTLTGELHANGNVIGRAPAQAPVAPAPASTSPPKKSKFRL